jgi:hypothetical protein
VIRLLIRMSRRRRQQKIDEFLAAVHRPAEVQAAFLSTLLKRAAGTTYGRKHGFGSIKTVEEFRRAVPLNTYEDLSWYIERVVDGDHNALFPSSDKVCTFAQTSGTTGKSKLIPVTASFLRDYQEGSSMWNRFCLRDHPEMLGGKILPIAAPQHETQTKRGVSVGSMSGIVSGTQGRLVRSLYAVPAEIASIASADVRWYTLMRVALTADVSFMSTANPSTLLALARLVDDRASEFIRDIHDGTLRCRTDVPKDILQRMRHALKPNRKRAAALDGLASQFGRLLPKHYWPRLSVVGCWKGGPLHLFLERLPEFYGQVTVRDIGLLASEGRLTIPVSDDGAGGVLNLSSTFFEFLPASESTSGEEPKLAHELEAGASYGLVLTTSCGLYRYQIQDIVRVDGFCGATPILTFINKGRHIASITGEKVSEYQVASAFKTVLGTKGISRFVVSPVWDGNARYAVLLDELDYLETDEWPSMLSQFDEQIRELNIEYSGKRSSGRLGPPELYVTRAGSIASTSDPLTAQSKPVYLQTEINYHQRFSVVRRLQAAHELVSAAF